jgi:hypothetical protein
MAMRLPSLKQPGQRESYHPKRSSSPPEDEDSDDDSSEAFWTAGGRAQQIRLAWVEGMIWRCCGCIDKKNSFVSSLAHHRCSPTIVGRLSPDDDSLT